MPQTQCVLDGYTYEVNPVENAAPKIKAVSVADGLAGRHYTVWPNHPSRTEINQTWPTLPAAMFAALDAKAALAGPLSYTHEDGTLYTVIALPPVYVRSTPGQDAFLQVSMRLYIVSSP